jgi:hypothetical protein
METNNDILMTYNSFNKKVKDHLSEPEFNLWGPGTFNGITNIKHIANLNGRDKTEVVMEILAQDGVKTDMFRKPHRYAHHLNSSQVVCYEFFRPLIDDNGKMAKALRLMNLPDESLLGSKAEFEKVLKDGDGTNYDFYLSYNGYDVFFEIKYTESGFGSCNGDTSHQTKFENNYEEQLKGSVCIKESIKDTIHFPEMQEYYQLFRNILSIKKDTDYVVVLFPGENSITNGQFEAFKDKYLSEEGKKHVKCVYWEDLTECMGERFRNKFFFYV